MEEEALSRTELIPEGMDEEPSLNPKLQKIMNLVPLDNLEEELQFVHPSNFIEGVTVHGEAMIDDPDRFLSLPNKIFENQDDLVSDVHKIGLIQGYVMVIKRSDRDKKVVIGCDRGGSYRTKIAQDKRKNKSASRLINCPFRILGKKTAEGLWKVEIKNLCHNHESSIDMAGHPYCRRFTEDEALQVKQMSRAGIKPRQILSSLRQNNPHLLAISRNIYSKTAQFKRESLGGRSIIQALLDELGDAGFSHNVKYDQMVI